MSESIIQISGVTRRFGQELALDNVTLNIPAGSVFGLVGENGAGKTTLLKHVHLTVRLPNKLESHPEVPGALTCSGGGHEWSVLCNGQQEQTESWLREARAEILDRRTPTLDEIFVARIGQNAS